MQRWKWQEGKNPENSETPLVMVTAYTTLLNILPTIIIKHDDIDIQTCQPSRFYREPPDF